MDPGGKSSSTPNLSSSPMRDGRVDDHRVTVLEQQILRINERVNHESMITQTHLARLNYAIHVRDETVKELKADQRDTKNSLIRGVWGFAIAASLLLFNVIWAKVVGP